MPAAVSPQKLAEYFNLRELYELVQTCWFFRGPLGDRVRFELTEQRALEWIEWRENADFEKWHDDELDAAFEQHCVSPKLSTLD